MSSTGPQMGIGLTRLLDAQQRFVRAGHPVWLRLRNFTVVQNQLWSQLGFSIAPSGGAQVGTTDILIDPPPSVVPNPIKAIGPGAGKLRFGSRAFLISHTFVQKQMTAFGYTDSTMVWRAANVVGLVTDNLVFSIEDYRHREVSGQTVLWILICNAGEIR